MGTNDRLALQLSNLGETLYFQGDLWGAEKALGEARGLDSAAGLKRQLGYDLAGFGDVFQAEGKLEDAHQVKDEALKLREELGDKSDAADARIALADLAIEEGHPGDESLLQAALADLEQLKAIDDEAQAYVVLTRALLSSGKSTEASKAVAKGTPIVAQSRDRGSVSLSRLSTPEWRPLPEMPLKVSKVSRRRSPKPRNLGLPWRWERSR